MISYVLTVDVSIGWIKWLSAAVPRYGAFLLLPASVKCCLVQVVSCVSSVSQHKYLCYFVRLHTCFYKRVVVVIFSSWTLVSWVPPGQFFLPVFSERELTFTFVRYLLSPVRLSVCRLSSVTFLHPTQAVQIFGSISISVQATSLRTLASSPLSECINCRQQLHASSKTLLQQNSPVLNWGCQLTQVLLYSGHKMVVLLILIVVVVTEGELFDWYDCMRVL